MMVDYNASLRAINHLAALGDTDIFPPAFEFQFYKEEAESIAQIAYGIDASNYRPKGCFECLTPKSELSFRIAHQLYPSDSLLYTAAVIEIGPNIEEMRLSVDGGPFSYRFISEQEEARLFSESSSFHDWLAHQDSLFGFTDTFDDLRYVIETDISDFYSRIYFHRIEHVLDDCGAPNQTRKIIENIIKYSRSRQSHGLPVGTSASRLLAEGLLHDTDQMIAQRADAYTRYVDDFRIVVRHQSDVHSTLCKLADHLMITEGLSLNASKTQTYTTNDARSMIGSRLSDIFNDQEIVRLNQYIKAVYDQEDISIQHIEDIDPIDLSDKLDSIMNRDQVDYTAVRVILKAMRAVTFLNPVDMIKRFGNLLYFTPRDFCMFVGSLAQRSPEEAFSIADYLSELITKRPFSEMVISRIWVAHLFVTQALPLSAAIFERLGRTDTVIERRQSILLKGLLRDRTFFRHQKTSFNQLGDWEKPALMLGASCLSKSEYSTWIDTVKDYMNDPFAKRYSKWLISNQESLFDKLKVQYFVKTKMELMSEQFEDLDNTDEGGS